METVSAAPEDSVDANPSSVKSDDSSPQTDNGRSSPPPKCVICLGTCKNKSFTDSCLHQFCFSCLLTWSKVKPECPLCKQNFRSIIHNVRSNHQYEEYMLEQRQEEVVDRLDIDSISNAAQRFRFRTTLTLPRRDTLAIQQLLLLAERAPRAPPARRRRSPASFRRTVYRHNLWARPLPDFTGRFRDCTPEFYRCNDAQMHRLVPWLNRELHYLLNENVPHVSYVLMRILDLLPHHYINSQDFCDVMRRYLGHRTEHFLHELYCFASTPYDMTGYDRNVQYTTDPRITTMVNEIISSSESDSDIVVVSPSTVPPPLPPPPADPAVIPIETISHSDTDDSSSEVMVVGYLKPPHERTPEVVDLLGSDSDVVLTDAPQPQPGPSRASDAAHQGPLVKLSLKCHTRAPASDSDSSAASMTAHAPPRARKRRRSRSSSSSWRLSPDASPALSSAVSSTASPAAAPSAGPRAASSDSSTQSYWSSTPSRSPASTSSSTSSSSDSDSDSSSSSRSHRYAKQPRKKSRRSAASKHDSSSRSKSKRSKNRDSRRSKRDRSTQTHKKNKKVKSKSRPSRDVKSTRRSNASVQCATPPLPEPRAGPSAGPAEASPSPGSSRRAPNHGRRLRSVVTLMGAGHSASLSPRLSTPPPLSSLPSTPPSLSSPPPLPSSPPPPAALYDGLRPLGEPLRRPSNASYSSDSESCDRWTRDGNQTPLLNDVCLNAGMVRNDNRLSSSDDDQPLNNCVKRT